MMSKCGTCKDIILSMWRADHIERSNILIVLFNPFYCEDLHIHLNENTNVNFMSAI